MDIATVAAALSSGDLDAALGAWLPECRAPRRARGARVGDVAETLVTGLPDQRFETVTVAGAAAAADRAEVAAVVARVAKRCDAGGSGV